jgi:hypothetical protein
LNIPSPSIDMVAFLKLEPFMYPSKSVTSMVLILSGSQVQTSREGRDSLSTQARERKESAPDAYRRNWT